MNATYLPLTRFLKNSRKRREERIENYRKTGRKNYYHNSDKESRTTTSTTTAYSP